MVRCRKIGAGMISVLSCEVDEIHSEDRAGFDQKAGREIAMPTHGLHSMCNLEMLSGFNVSVIWSRWVDSSAHLTAQGVGG